MKQQAKIVKKRIFVFKSINVKNQFNTDPTGSVVVTVTVTGVI